MNTVTLFILVGLICFILTSVAFIDVAYKNFGGPGKKAAWGLIALIPFIGFIIYFLFGFRRGTRQKPLPSPENPE